MRPRLKLSLKTAIYVLLGVITLLLIVPIPINIEAPALEIMYADPSHMEERTVRIQGWFNFNIIVRWHDFRGTITISGYPETISAHGLSPMRLHAEPSERWSLWGTRSDLLFYTDVIEWVTTPGNIPMKAPRRVVFGAIYATPFFGQAMINVRHGDRPWSLSESPVIVLNARTREDAREVLLRNLYRR